MSTARSQDRDKAVLAKLVLGQAHAFRGVALTNASPYRDQLAPGQVAHDAATSDAAPPAAAPVVRTRGAVWPRGPARPPSPGPPAGADPAYFDAILRSLADTLAALPPPVVGHAIATLSS